MKTDERLRQIARYMEGNLEAHEVAAMETALQQDAALRRQYLEYMNIDSALGEMAALPDSETMGVCEGSGETRPRLHWILTAVAAVLICVVSVSLLISSKHGAVSNEVAARVMQVQEVDLEGHSDPIQVGDELKLSTVNVTQGLLRLKLSTGVQIELMGPLSGHFESPMRLHLTHGRLNADVGKDGKGFTVITKAGEIIDQGTQFGVDVPQDGQAFVSVFSGQVRVEGHKSQSLTMEKGEGLSLRTGKKPRRLTSVNLKPYEMQLDVLGKSSLIQSVTDSIKEDGFCQFYGIVPQGMAEGTIVYTDRGHVVWTAHPGESFPEALLGADVVRPFHYDRHQREMNITLHLTQPSVVYVLCDARRRPLKWLEQEFERTNMRVSAGPWRPTRPVVRDVQRDAQGRILLDYVVWRKEVPQAGALTLGPPHAGGQGFAGAMYGIAVKVLVPGD